METLTPAQLEHHRMILGGVERRAQIDNETLKALLAINGGGILALLSVSSVLLSKPGQEEFLRFIFIAILLLAGGLVLAVLHNQCRRECSRIHDLYGLRPPPGTLFGWNLGRPRACWFSLRLRDASLGFFVLASALVGLAGVHSVSTTAPAALASQVCPSPARQ